MQQTDKRIKEIKKIIENYERKIKELQMDLDVPLFMFEFPFNKYIGKKRRRTR